MSRFFDDTMQGLLEAVAIDKGEIPLVEKEDMPAPTSMASERAYSGNNNNVFIHITPSNLQFLC